MNLDVLLELVCTPLQAHDLRIKCTVFGQKKEDHLRLKRWSSLLAVAGAGLEEVKMKSYPKSEYYKHDHLFTFEQQLFVTQVLSIF